MTSIIPGERVSGLKPVLKTSTTNDGSKVLKSSASTPKGRLIPLPPLLSDTPSARLSPSNRNVWLLSLRLYDALSSSPAAKRVFLINVGVLLDLFVFGDVTSGATFSDCVLSCRIGD